MADIEVRLRIGKINSSLKTNTLKYVTVELHIILYRATCDVVRALVNSPRTLH